MDFSRFLYLMKDTYGVPRFARTVGTYALVGIGAVFARGARAPITAVVILFKLTGEYSITPLLMLAIVLPTATSRLLIRDTIYTLKLRRPGAASKAPARGALIGGQHVDGTWGPYPLPYPSPPRSPTPPTCSSCSTTAHCR